MNRPAWAGTEARVSRETTIIVRKDAGTDQGGRVLGLHRPRRQPDLGEGDHQRQRRGAEQHQLDPFAQSQRPAVDREERQAAHRDQQDERDGDRDQQPRRGLRRGLGRRGHELLAR